MYKPHTYCRACGYAKPGAPGIKANYPERLVEVFDLGLQPLPNDFRKEGEERAGYAPLKVLLCPRCSLAQLSVVVNPEILYSHYAYVTSKSEMMHRHFEVLWAAIVEERKPESVLEIGSNDGDFLQYIKVSGAARVLGVDPAMNLAKIAEAKGVPTVPCLWNEETADLIGKFDCVIARHVFCHTDDWIGFMRAVERVADDNTLLVIEAPYAGNTLTNCEFDQVYHEHLSFLSFKAVDELVKDTPWEIVNILHFDIHGGTSVIMLRKRGMTFPQKQAVREMIELESLSVEKWQAFSVEAHNQINRLSHTVRAAVAQGKRVAGLGASAKSTVWVNACRFTRKEIMFIADNTPQKQGTTSPGSDIPIADEGAILRELPDYVVLFAWNYKDEILEKFKRARELGVKFIVPVPTITIV